MTEGTQHAATAPQQSRRNKHRPKGRGADAVSQEAIRHILNDAPLQRDHLIENLHLLHDAFGGLSKPHLVALAEEMGLAMAEIYEVASFYAHFDILVDGDQASSITVRVCDGPACAMAGAADLLQNIGDKAGQDVQVVSGPCMGRCDNAPVVVVGHNHITGANAKKVGAAVAAKNVRTQAVEAPRYQDYLDKGGFRILEACLSGKMSFDDVVSILKNSGLRGLGGAGFPSSMKWKFVRDEPGPRFLAVNADEGEPGTFKDRHILVNDPYAFLEGVLIAAWAVEAADTYIYLRDEYADIRLSLAAIIAQIEKAGRAGHTRLHLRRGAGAYICGEESAMLESIEGKRGIPRQKPPFPSQVGLFGRPTLIHNVETLYWTAKILEKGAGWYQDAGRPHFFSVSGRVQDPGVKLAPAGITVAELIAEHCGGMAAGHTLKAYLPGGASGGILPASLSDLPLDFGTLEKYGCFIGSAAVVVLSDKDDMADLTRNLMHFFKEESCGQCTPCRVGTEKAVALMKARRWDVPVLKQLCDAMSDASICGLGQAAPNPLRSLLSHFPEDTPGSES